MKSGFDFPVKKDRNLFRIYFQDPENKPKKINIFSGDYFFFARVSSEISITV